MALCRPVRIAMAAVDIAEVRRAVETLMPPGSVVELRVPRTGQHPLGGYFNDRDLMAQTAARISGKAEGVYMTLNPVKADLLARASNRLVFAKHTTSDTDVV